MSICLYKKYKSSVDNNNFDYFNAVKINVLDSAKVLLAQPSVDFRGNTGILGFTISDSKITAITKDKLFVKGIFNQMDRCNITLTSASANSLQVDLDSIVGSTNLKQFKFQYTAFKGSLVEALQNNSLLQYLDLGICNFDAVTDNLDNNGVTIGNLLANFPGLLSINCNVVNYELLPFINAARAAGRILANNNYYGLGLLYGASKAYLNGARISSSTAYIMWTNSTISTYKSDDTLIETYNL